MHNNFVMQHSDSNTSTISKFGDLGIPQADNEQLIIPLEIMYPDDYFFTETPYF